MRIIAGEARGRVLRTPPGKSTRPTDARSREMLFNILGAEVIGARVLDLYAGSGAVGLEALSRGASTCTFIEQNAAAANAIRTNLKTLGWSERGQVWQTSMRSALHRMAERAEYSGGFDLLFADPPFHETREFEDLEQRVDILAELLHNVGVFAAGQS
jgi:16S rRNA (guanine966-N2)-methyltransferase